MEPFRITPLGLAVSLNESEVAYLFPESGARTMGAALFWATEHDNLAIMRETNLGG